MAIGNIPIDYWYLDTFKKIEDQTALGKLQNVTANNKSPKLDAIDKESFAKTAPPVLSSILQKEGGFSISGNQNVLNDTFKPVLNYESYKKFVDDKNKELAAGKKLDPNSRETFEKFARSKRIGALMPQKTTFVVGKDNHDITNTSSLIKYLRSNGVKIDSSSDFIKLVTTTTNEKGEKYSFNPKDTKNYIYGKDGSVPQHDNLAKFTEKVIKEQKQHMAQQAMETPQNQPQPMRMETNIRASQVSTQFSTEARQKFSEVKSNISGTPTSEQKSKLDASRATSKGVIQKEQQEISNGLSGLDREETSLKEKKRNNQMTDGAYQQQMTDINNRRGILLGRRTAVIDYSMSSLREVRQLRAEALYGMEHAATQEEKDGWANLAAQYTLIELDSINNLDQDTLNAIRSKPDLLGAFFTNEFLAGDKDRPRVNIEDIPNMSDSKFKELCAGQKKYSLVILLDRARACGAKIDDGILGELIKGAYNKIPPQGWTMPITHQLTDSKTYNPDFHTPLNVAVYLAKNINSNAFTAIMDQINSEFEQRLLDQPIEKRQAIVKAEIQKLIAKEALSDAEAQIVRSVEPYIVEFMGMSGGKQTRGENPKDRWPIAAAVFSQPIG